MKTILIILGTITAIGLVYYFFRDKINPLLGIPAVITTNRTITTLNTAQIPIGPIGERLTRKSMGPTM